MATHAPGSTTGGEQGDVLELGNVVGGQRGRPSARWCRCSGQPTPTRRSTGPTTPATDSLPYLSEMPHGGFGESGHGKDLSVYSLEEHTRIKHVMVKL